MAVIEQGDIWLVEEPDLKPRPCLVLTRSSVVPLLSSLLVAPLTRTARNIPSEVQVGPADGVRFESVASFDNVTAIRRAFFTRRLGHVDPSRWPEVGDAMRIAIGC